MNEIMRYAWLSVFIAIPVVGCIYVYNYNRKNPQRHLRKSYWKPLVVELVTFGIWVMMSLTVVATGNMKTTTKTFNIEPLTVYSSPENIYVKINSTKDSYVNFAITGKGTYLVPLGDTSVYYVEAESRPKATVTYYRLDSPLATFIGMQGALVTKKTHVDIQVPIGGIDATNATNADSAFEGHSVNDLLK